MITVELADDQALVRAGFRALLDSEPDFDVVAEAADGEAAVTQARRHLPDVVLMDIRMLGPSVSSAWAIVPSPFAITSRRLKPNASSRNEIAAGASR